MSRYAQRTSVPVDRSKAEIERILERYGASRFFSGWERETSRAILAFEFEGRQIRFVIGMPNPEQRTSQKNYEQACRQRWRALALVIKAKLEAIDAGITSFEKEFMADTVGPGGRTLSEMILPQLEEAMRSGKMPALLPDLR